MKRLLYILPLLLFFACQREDAELPLYQHYSVRADLTVAQVKGFRLSDTVKTDVVILVADDSVAWQGLKQEFDIRTTEGVTSWMGAIDEPARRVKRSVRPAWRAMAVHEEMTIAFYRVDTEVHADALRDYQLNNMTDNNNH